MLEMKQVERRIALTLDHLRTCPGEAGIQTARFSLVAVRCRLRGAGSECRSQQLPALDRGGDCVNEPRFEAEATDRESWTSLDEAHPLHYSIEFADFGVTYPGVTSGG